MRNFPRSALFDLDFFERERDLERDRDLDFDLRVLERSTERDFDLLDFDFDLRDLDFERDLRLFDTGDREGRRAFAIGDFERDFFGLLTTGDLERDFFATFSGSGVGERLFFFLPSAMLISLA